MIVNRPNLLTLGVGFNTAFTQGLGQGESQYQRIATPVPSTTGEQEYGWLGKVPNVREWIGDRQVQNISAGSYRIKNKDFELTLAVDRNDIEDDNIGIYAPLFQEMGAATASAYDRSVWGLLKAGFTTPCYDGQYFFDTDHPVLNENKVEVSVANTDGGAGAPWFLIDDRRTLKPIILQVRKAWQFVPKDKLDDDNVYHSKKFLYGVDGRYNVGYGFWQYCWGSKQPLDADSYGAARAALSGMTGDYGRPLGIMPRLLIVPPSLEKAAREILQNDRNEVGATNPWKGTAELLVVPWLA
ncbi:Mu-like prophage major head subunit gpT family protein [Xanthobacter autotrophicus]|uniref:Mu-like prophage major head subunit gpT family protein n=1 Tax=Xanthobacter TaxID=279 RepID=UPI0024AA361D|nr:Mu-like prophage major head subunit gpT family protein [Xanthobacter autotrophicus]MDI4664709.1 Mu-like prophage major head subunit gpT family protein [Xanthobacter autotrophicus]